MIEKAQHLIKNATITDIDLINELLCDMLQDYHQYDLLVSQQELNYEMTRTEIYLETKAKKKNGETKMSDTDIWHYAKHKALSERGDFYENKAKKNEMKSRIEMLKSKKIELLTLDKVRV